MSTEIFKFKLAKFYIYFPRIELQLIKMSENRRNSKKMHRSLKLRVYADTKQGGRDYMEDFVRIKIADANSPGGEVAYLGVFDGHGGPEAARLAQATLGAEISRLVGPWTDDNDATVVKAIKQAFLNTHRLMSKFVGMKFLFYFNFNLLKS